MKKAIIILFVGVMVYAMAATAFAMDIKENQYQMVLNKLNEEYSTDVHFAVENEPAFYSGSGCMDITPEEFEAYIRKLIVENEKANKEAENSARLLKTREICEQGNGVCSQLSGAIAGDNSAIHRVIRGSGNTNQ